MPKKSNSHFPTRASLIEATFKAITGCGGSATNDEIQEHVIEILELPDHIINMMHADNTQTRLHYELRWARTYFPKDFDTARMSANFRDVLILFYLNTAQ